MLKPIVSLYSMDNTQIEKFLTSYYEDKINIENKLEWERNCIYNWGFYR